MSRIINLPPIGFLFCEDDQSTNQSWMEFIVLMENWNKTHTAQFVYDKDILCWGIEFGTGVNDPEMALLKNELAAFQKTHVLDFFHGYEEMRREADFEHSDFISFIGDGYHDDAYVNDERSVQSSTECEACGESANRTAQLIEPLIFDESFLDANNQTNRDNDFRLDFINSSGHTTLVSNRVKEFFETEGIDGYTLHSIISKATGAVSERLFLISADLRIVDPCHTHTPRSEEGTCPVCGNDLGPLYGYFYVPKSVIGDAELFSLNRFGITDIYYSNRLFNAMRNAGLKFANIFSGIDMCDH